MKRRISQVSGATLGYITGNLPGAVQGYKLGGKAYDYMYPTPKKRGRSRSHSHGPTRRSRSVGGHRHTSRSRSRAMSIGTNNHAHPSSDIGQEMIDKYHPIEHFEHKKTRFNKHKQHAPKTLKGKIKKEIKKAAIKMSPPCQLANYKGQAQAIIGYASGGTGGWNISPFSVFFFATDTNGLRFMNGGLRNNGNVNDIEFGQIIETSQQFPELVGKAGGSLVNVAGTSNQAVNQDNSIVAVQQDKYQNKFWLTSYEADINLCNDKGFLITYDVYEFQAQRNMAISDDFNTVQTAMQSCLRECTPILDANAQQLPLTTWRNTFGNLPEDIPNLWKHWKIINRTRIQLEAGTSTNIQFKGPKKEIIDWAKYNKFSTIKHLTTEFLIVVGNGPCPGLNKSDAFLGFVTSSTKIKYRMMGSQSAQQKIPVYTIESY